MAGLDLTGIRRVVDEWIVDTVEITRDRGTSDDTLDPETGEIVEAPPTDLYTGRGAVQPLGQSDGVTDPDVARYWQEAGARYRGLLPLAESEGLGLLAGDLLKVLTVAAATSDPALLNREFQLVDKPAPSSFAALRILYLKPV